MFSYACGADLAYFWRSVLIFPTKNFLKPRIKNKNQIQIGYPAITINFFPYPVCSLIKNPSAKLFKSTAIPSWLAPYLIICLARVSSSGFLRLVTLGKQNPWNPDRRGFYLRVSTGPKICSVNKGSRLLGGGCEPHHWGGNIKGPRSPFTPQGCVWLFLLSPGENEKVSPLSKEELRKRAKQ